MEFKDERIDNHLGRIYRNGMIFATILTVIYLFVRFLYLDQLRLVVQYKSIYIITELSVLVCAIAVLVIGLIKFARKKDERIMHEMARYYLTGTKVFLYVTISAYAVSIPIFRELRNSSTADLNSFINALLTYGLLYIYFCFRKHGIEINYSIINNPKGKYLLYVLRNIGVFALVVLIPFIIPGLIDAFFIGKEYKYLIQTLIIGSWCVSFLCIQYFIVSLVEKLYYDDDRPILLKKGLMIFVILYIVLATWSTLGKAAFYYMITLEPTDADKFEYMFSLLLDQFSVGDSLISIDMSMVIRPALLCCFAAQLCDNKLFNLLKAWFAISVLNSLDGMLLSKTLMYTLSSEHLTLYMNIVSGISNVLYALLVVILIIAVIILIKKHGMSKLMIILPFFSYAGTAFSFILSHFNIDSNVTNYISLCWNYLSMLFVLMLYYIIIKKYDQKQLQQTSEI